MTTEIPAPFSGSNYWKTSERTSAKGEIPCAHCGRPVTDDDENAVRVIEGGSAYALTEERFRDDESDDAGDMGTFAVGNTCARKLRKAGVFVGPRG